MSTLDQSRELKSNLYRQFALPILRQSSQSDLVSISRALAKGGLAKIEITLMSEAAYGAIEDLARDMKVVVGAGTVCTLDQAQNAHKVGARFLVSPGFDDDVANYAREKNLLYVPGVLTPTEIMRAKKFGCDTFKVFPAQAVGGPGYLKHLSGPFPNHDWVATGGVSVEDIPAYLAAGAKAIGLGSSLIPKGALEKSDWSAIEKTAESVVQAVARARGK